MNLKSFWAPKPSMILAGGLFGVLGALAVNWGNPANMGICAGCFLRDIAGALHLHWAGLLLALPLLFLAALAFASLGLLFTAWLPSMDHMSLPFFLVVMPLGFASSTYFPLPDAPVLAQVVLANPLHHLAEGLRWLLVAGRFTAHLPAAAGLCLAMLVLLVPIDMRLLRRRVFGDR